jgi:hypothetical protein
LVGHPATTRMFRTRVERELGCTNTGRHSAADRDLITPPAPLRRLFPWRSRHPRIKGFNLRIHTIYALGSPTRPADDDWELIWLLLRAPRPPFPRSESMPALLFISSHQGQRFFFGVCVCEKAWRRAEKKGSFAYGRTRKRRQGCSMGC